MQARVESKLDKFLKYRYYFWFVGHKLYDSDHHLTFKLKVHFFTEKNEEAKQCDFKISLNLNI